MLPDDKWGSFATGSSFRVSQMPGQSSGGHRKTRWAKAAIGLTVLLCGVVALVVLEASHDTTPAPGGTTAIPAPTQRDLAPEWVAFRSGIPYGHGSLGYLAWAIKDSLANLFATGNRTTISGTPGGEIDIALKLGEGEYCVYYAQWDVANILKVIHGSGYLSYTLVRLSGTTPVKDVYGRGTDTEVLRAVYSRSAIDRIDWQGFEETNVYRIATSFWHDSRFWLL
jgi:hypothetical protein